MQCLACRREQPTGAEYTIYYGTASRQRLPGGEIGPGRLRYAITGRQSGWVCTDCVQRRSRASLALLATFALTLGVLLLLPRLGVPAARLAVLPLLLAYAIGIQFLPPGMIRQWGELLVLKAHRSTLAKQGFNAFLLSARYERLKRRRDPFEE